MDCNELQERWFEAYPVEGDQLIPTKVYGKNEVDEYVSKLKDQISKERSAKVDYHISANDLSDGLAKAYAEIRRLKRALYKALANWAHEAKYDYDDEFSLWDKMEEKCLKQVEVYK